MTECPRCKQKLMLKLTMLVGATVICPQCAAALRITSRNPDRMEVTGDKIPSNVNAKPESYG
jgi:hypothetical protein